MCLLFNRGFLSSEQYAVSEFAKTSKDGQDIDGEVLTYLELTQVDLSFVIKALARCVNVNISAILSHRFDVVSGD